MDLTLHDQGQDSANRTGDFALPPRRDRNQACHCGSGSKYKRCCLEQDEALRRQRRGAALPAWMDGSRSKLRQFEKYVCNVFALPDLLANLMDTRRDPQISTVRNTMTRAKKSISSFGTATTSRRLILTKEKFG